MNRTTADDSAHRQACHHETTRSNDSAASLEALLMRATQLLNSSQHEDLLFVFALEASFSRAAVSVAKLCGVVPSLGPVFASMRSQLERTFLLTHVTRFEFSLLLKAAFELLLMALCDHYGIPAAQAAMSLMDRLQLLKPILQPPSRLNCFFELKDVVNYVAHPKDAQCSVSLALLDDALHAFVKVLNECVAELLSDGGVSRPECTTTAAARPAPSTTRTAPQQQAPAVVTRNEPLPPKLLRTKVTSIHTHKTKTRLCAYWQAGGACPYAGQCRYAHGRAELVVALDATQGNG